MTAEPPDGPDVPPGTRDVAWERRIAHAEVNLRRVNEAIERGRHRAGPAVFVCECGRLGCTRTIDLTMDDYEGIRTGFERFVVLPGHEVEGVDEIVADHDGYRVVAKQGEAAEIARDGDARLHPGGPAAEG